MLPSTAGRGPGGVGGSSGFVDHNGNLIPPKPQSGAPQTAQPPPPGNMMISASSSCSSSQPTAGFYPAASSAPACSFPMHRNNVMAAPPPTSVPVSMVMGGRMPPQAPPMRAPPAPVPFSFSAPPPVPFAAAHGLPHAPPPPPPPPPPHQVVSFAPPLPPTTSMAALRQSTMNYRATSDEKSVCSSTTGLSFLSSASSAVATSASSHKRRREQMTCSSSSLVGGAGGGGGGGGGLGTAPSFTTDVATQEDLEDDFFDEAEDLVEVDVYTGGGGGGGGAEDGLEPMQSHQLEDAEFNSADEDDDLDIDAIIENLDNDNLVTADRGEGAASDKDSDAATYRDCRASAAAAAPAAAPPKPTRIRRKHRRRGSSGKAPLRRSLKRMRIHGPSCMGFDGSGSLSSSSSLSTLSTRTVGTAKVPPPGGSDEDSLPEDSKLPAMDTAEETDYGSFNRILGGLHAERRMRQEAEAAPEAAVAEQAGSGRFLQRQSSLSSSSSGVRSSGTSPPTRTVRLPYHSQIY